LISACHWGLTEAVKSTPAPATPTAVSQDKEAAEITHPAASPAPKTPAAPTVYLVRKGDSLSKIAQAHGLGTQQLADFNKLKLTRPIIPGQKLLLPPGKDNSTTASSASPEKLSRQEAIIRSALSYQGVRYRYGGLSSRGLDCSGLVVRVMMNQGIMLPHRAATLYTKGEPVVKEDLKQGDLVFFHTRGRSLMVSHVGIYLGEGKFIHASSGKGSVRIDTLLSGYYAQRYVGARRIIPD